MIVSKSGEKFVIIWEVNPIPAAVYKRVHGYFLTTGYGPVTAADTAKISQLAAENGLSPQQVNSIRNITIKDKIVKNHGRMNAMMARIAAEYTGGRGVLTLAKKYDFPPLNLFRGIMLHKGVPSSAVYRVFTYKIRPDELFTGRDLEQYMIAERNDANSTFNQDLAAERAAQAERDFVSLLTSRGIKLRTQEDLVKEQVAAHGRAVNTPDVLFESEVEINGKPVKWIDYKDYVGTTVGFLLRSNKEQAGRYVAEWGPGALCYGPGFVASIEIPGTMLLDCTQIITK